jgi:hypothetical protein
LGRGQEHRQQHQGWPCTADAIGNTRNLALFRARRNARRGRHPAKKLQHLVAQLARSVGGDVGPTLEVVLVQDDELSARQAVYSAAHSRRG